MGFTTRTFVSLILKIKANHKCFSLLLLSIRQNDIVETLHIKNPTVQYAQKLRDECENYNLNLFKLQCKKCCKQFLSIQA